MLFALAECHVRCAALPWQSAAFTLDDLPIADQAGIRIPQGALDHVFLEQRESGLDLRRGDQFHPIAEGLARGHAAL